MKLTNIAIGLAVSVLIIAGGILLLSDGDSDVDVSNSNQNLSSEIEQPEQNDSASEQEVDREIEIDMFNFDFSVDQIQVAPGETIKIIATSTSGTHDFVVDEFNTMSPIANTGETVETIFTVPEDFSGSVEFYCSIGNHRELGMVGEIVVSGL